jgi:hypothetical protein
MAIKRATVDLISANMPAGPSFANSSYNNSTVAPFSWTLLVIALFALTEVGFVQVGLIAN